MVLAIAVFKCASLPCGKFYLTGLAQFLFSNFVRSYLRLTVMLDAIKNKIYVYV